MTPEAVIEDLEREAKFDFEPDIKAHWEAMADAVRALLLRRAKDAEAKYQWMVDRAADEHLDGYREMGEKLCAMEKRAQDAERERDALRANDRNTKRFARTQIDRIRELEEQIAKSECVMGYLDDQDRIRELEDECKAKDGLINAQGQRVRELERERDELRKRNELLTDHYEQKMKNSERATKLEERVQDAETAARDWEDRAANLCDQVLAAERERDRFESIKNDVKMNCANAKQEIGRLQDRIRELESALRPAEGLRTWRELVEYLYVDSHGFASLNQIEDLFYPELSYEQCNALCAALRRDPSSGEPEDRGE